MGLASGETIEPATALGEVESLRLDVKAAVDVALAQNHDVQVAQINSEDAELAVKNARHGVLPSLSATATTGVRAQYEAEGETVRALAGLGNNTYPWMAVSSNLTVPLGNRASRSELTTAKATASQRREELANTRRTVRSQVEEQVRTLSSSQERVRLADAQLALAQETLKGEESLVDAGRSIYKDLLEARNELARVQGDAVKARIDFRLAQIELLRLQGLLEIE